MNRAYAFTTASVVTLVAIVWHRIGVGMLDPSGVLYEVAADATNLNGAARAAFWHEIGVLWLPLIAIIGVWLFVAINEWRRQSITGASRVPR